MDDTPMDAIRRIFIFILPFRRFAISPIPINSTSETFISNVRIENEFRRPSMLEKLLFLGKGGAYSVSDVRNRSDRGIFSTDHLRARQLNGNVQQEFADGGDVFGFPFTFRLSNLCETNKMDFGCFEAIVPTEEHLRIRLRASK